MKRPEGIGGDPPLTPPTPATRAARSSSPRAPVSRQAIEEVTATPQARVSQPRGPQPRAPQAARASRAATRERRRDERAEVRRFTRRSRQRRLAISATVGAFAMLIGGVAVVSLSPLMALDTVEVVGTSRLDAAAVGAALDYHLGTPLALLDESAIRDDLAAFPLIRSFSTEVIPPHTLVLRIVERAPIGAIERGAVIELVDAAGVVVESSGERPEGIPLIAPGSTDADSVAFRSVAEVLTALPAELRAQVDVISASTRDDVTFTMSGVGHRVVWGSAERSAFKARVLAAAMMATGQGAPSEYDVSAPESLVVRLL